MSRLGVGVSFILIWSPIPFFLLFFKFFHSAPTSNEKVRRQRSQHTLHTHCNVLLTITHYPPDGSFRSCPSLPSPRPLSLFPHSILTNGGKWGIRRRIRGQQRLSMLFNMMFYMLVCFSSLCSYPVCPLYILPPFHTSSTHINNKP